MSDAFTVIPSPGSCSFSYQYSLLHTVRTSLWGFPPPLPPIIRIKVQNISQQWCHSTTQPSCLPLVNNMPGLGSVCIMYITDVWAGFYLQIAKTFKIPFAFFVIILCSLLKHMQTLKMKSTEFYLIYVECTRFNSWQKQRYCSFPICMHLLWGPLTCFS
jgi:hypothetical protein